MSGSRHHRPHLKRPVWIIVLVSFFIIFLISVYIYPSRSFAACYIFSPRGCTMFEQLPTTPSRELTDEETIAQVVFKELLKTPPVHSKSPKIAFMFLTPGNLPFERLWDKFFHVSTLLLVRSFLLIYFLWTNFSCSLYMIKNTNLLMISAFCFWWMFNLSLSLYIVYAGTSSFLENI